MAHYSKENDQLVVRPKVPEPEPEANSLGADPWNVWPVSQVQQSPRQPSGG